MRQLKKLLTALFFSCLLFMPKKAMRACGPWPAPPEEYRISFFEPSIGDAAGQFTPYYFSTNKYYKADGVEEFATTIEADENCTEWQAELKQPFAKQDFYKAMEDYDYKVIADSANELDKANTFIHLLRQGNNKAYYNYYKLAKSVEMFNNTGSGSDDPWGLANKAQGTLPLVNEVEKTLQSTKNSFIQQRVAYVLCRLYFYANKAVDFANLYAKYFAGSKGKSWVVAAAKYYNTELLYSDSLHNREYYRGMVDVIDASKDKRIPAIRRINEQQEDTVLAYMQTNHQKATAIAAYALRYPGYALTKIKKIYALEPHSKFIPLLLTREINKLEDWLFTNQLTEYKTSASADVSYYSEDDNISRQFKNQNYKDDSIYAARVQSFAADLIKDDGKNYALMVSLCHLNFLAKNYAAAMGYCEKVLAGADKNSAEYMQAKINSVVLLFQTRHAVDDEVKNNITGLMGYLDKLNQSYNAMPGVNSGMEDALLVYFGRMALKYHDVVNATLLLSRTSKPWGEYRTGAEKSAYFILYHYAVEKDYDKLLEILRSKNKTPYEKYFTKTTCTFYGNVSVTYSPEHFNSQEYVDSFWSINKVLDLKGTYFVNRDSLDKALEAFAQIPSDFWRDSLNVYNNYLTGNPFSLSIYDTHSYYDSMVKNNPDKKVFIEKLADMKKRAATETNSEVKAKLYYMIGNAYYSMTYYGKFWLMSRLWWGRDDWNEEDNANYSPEFKLNYYGAARAQPWYQLAFNTTRFPKNAAYYCLYLTMCENNRRSYNHYINNAQNSNSEEYQPSDFLFLKSLRAKPGSEEFYRRLIKECPLYADFKSKV